MMRSTFAQLAETEQARAKAVEAWQDAEQVRLRFSDINRDISDLNRELATKVKELKVAQDEMLRKGRIEQLSQITATIAHEIRNPLGAIRTSTFMLERKISKAGLDAGELIERINNSVKRCDLIITQLNDFVRIKEPRKVVAKLDDWLSQVLREEAKSLPDAIFMECSLGLDERQVAFDPVQLQRAVVHILNNACEALQNFQSPQEGAAKRKCIWVTTLITGTFASIRIVDNGPGILPEFLAKVREPLFTTKSFGSGLGIPVVDQILQLQGGHLDISSEPGTGATIIINLPLIVEVDLPHVA
jgi:signal transduction histidine kinase